MRLGLRLGLALPRLVGSAPRLAGGWPICHSATKVGRNSGYRPPLAARVNAQGHEYRYTWPVGDQERKSGTWYREISPKGSKAA